MNVNGRELGSIETLKVVSLFEGAPPSEMLLTDPLGDLILESQIEGELLSATSTCNVRLVDEGQFPDDSIYILEDQLLQLKRRLERIKFYMGELDDIIPR
jgi:hypothetical protein